MSDPVCFVCGSTAGGGPVCGEVRCEDYVFYFCSSCHAKGSVAKLLRQLPGALKSIDRDAHQGGTF